eukprot:6198398-Pleurochrysis_carterae.AAC.1
MRDGSHELRGARPARGRIAGAHSYLPNSVKVWCGASSETTTAVSIKGICFAMRNREGLRMMEFAFALRALGAGRFLAQIRFGVSHNNVLKVSSTARRAWSLLERAS